MKLEEWKQEILDKINCLVRYERTFGSPYPKMPKNIYDIASAALRFFQETMSPEDIEEAIYVKDEWQELFRRKDGSYSREWHTLYLRALHVPFKKIAAKFGISFRQSQYELEYAFNRIRGFECYKTI
jgi:hypothetical protein